MRLTMKNIEEEAYGSSVYFPGGTFSLTKCSTGEIWVHLVINNLESDIVESRMDAAPGKKFECGKHVKDIEEAEISNHFAIKISVQQ